MELVVGIDVGFSASGRTSAMTMLAVVRRGGTVVIEATTKTAVMTSAEIEANLRSRHFPFAESTLRLVTLDAPLTPPWTPPSPNALVGRHVDRRFSRGWFSNAKRGPQPSSIAVPKQGRPLHAQGMRLLELLAYAGFPYMPMPHGPVGILPERATLEVLPKLTSALMTPSALVAARPATGFNRQIDNWLFAHLFATKQRPGDTVAACGSARAGMRALLRGCLIKIDKSVHLEAHRIHMTLTNRERHEAIGSFVAAFQGALALADVTALVGSDDGHVLLPRRWHRDWERAWQETGASDGAIRRVDLRRSHPSV